MLFCFSQVESNRHSNWWEGFIGYCGPTWSLTYLFYWVKLLFFFLTEMILNQPVSLCSLLGGLLSWKRRVIPQSEIFLSLGKLLFSQIEKLRKLPFGCCLSLCVCVCTHTSTHGAQASRWRLSFEANVIGMLESQQWRSSVSVFSQSPSQWGRGGLNILFRW